jgi:hypothetical protein
LQNLLLHCFHFPRLAFLSITKSMQMEQSVRDVVPKLLNQGISKTPSMPPCCLYADKNLAVPKRKHIRGPTLTKKFSMQPRHSPIGDEQHGDFFQSTQLCAPASANAQNESENFLRGFLHRGQINPHRPLEIANEYPRAVRRRQTHRVSKT